MWRAPDLQSERAVSGGLLQCFVRREQMPQLGLGCSRYSLFLCTGGGQEENGKFLLAALQTSRYIMPMVSPAGCSSRVRSCIEIFPCLSCKSNPSFLVDCIKFKRMPLTHHWQLNARVPPSAPAGAG